MDPGQRLDRDACLARDVDDALADHARRGGNRDQHLVRTVLGEDLRELLRGAEHPDVVHAQVLLARVVVDQPDRRVAERRALQQLLDDQLCRVPGADDDHFLAPRDKPACARALHQRAREHPRACHEREQQQPVHDRDRARQPDARNRIREVDDDRRDKAGDGDTARGAPHVARRDVAPPAVVKAEQDKDRELDEQDDPDRPVEHRLVVRRDLRVEAQTEGEIPGSRRQAAVDDQLPEAVPGDRQRDHAALLAATAPRMAETIRSCRSASIPAHIGIARFWREASSVAGRSPGFPPR